MISRTVRTVPQLTLGPAVELFTLRRTASLEDISIDGRFLLLVPQALGSYEPYAVWTNAISTRRLADTSHSIPVILWKRIDSASGHVTR